MSRTSNLPEPARARPMELTGHLPSTLPETHRPKTDTRWLGAMVLLCGFGLFGGLGFWAGTHEIQSAVVGSGAFEPEGDLQVVQHFDGGIVREIRVKDGDRVEAGEVLALLDDGRLQIQMSLLRAQLAGALARDARLEAELAKAREIEPGRELRDLISGEPRLARILTTQTEVFQSNRRADDGSVSIFRERIGQLRQGLDGIAERVALLNAQRAVVAEELEGLESLFERGLVPKARLTARQEDKISLDGRLAASEAERLQRLTEIAEIEQQILQVERQRGIRIADEKQQVTELVVDLRERMAATRQVIARTVVTAPMGGTVVNMSLNTIGAVLAPGQGLLEIVPAGRDQVVVARISAGDIDDVTIGGAARVRLSAYSYRQTPLFDGTITHVAADARLDQQSGASYYEVHVAVPPEAFAAVPGVVPVPGMPAQVMLSTGAQTVLTYLLDPVVGGLELAMLERE